MATHSSTLAWKIPWMEEPGKLRYPGKSRIGLNVFTFTFHFHALEKEMATHSSAPAWRIPGTEEPGGLQSMRSQSRTRLSNFTLLCVVFYSPILSSTLTMASLIAQLEKNYLQCRRPRFDSWVRKIRWRRDRLPTPVSLGFSCGSAGKAPACSAGDLGSIPGLGRPPGGGEGYPLQYSGLESPMDRGAWQATVHRSQRVRHG